MRKLTAILFENDSEYKEYSNRVCEKLSDLPTNKVFCGVWGKILFNNVECISAITGCINHFIDNTDKTEIIFGCCKKDYEDIISRVNTENCFVELVLCKNL